MSEENVDVEKELDEKVIDSAVEQEPAAKASREAKKYRLQLREVEQQLEHTQSLLAEAQKQILEAELNPAEKSILALTKTDIHGFFNGDGTLNRDLLQEIRTGWREEHAALLRKPIPNTWDRPAFDSPVNDFVGAFKPDFGI